VEVNQVWVDLPSGLRAASEVEWDYDVIALLINASHDRRILSSSATLSRSWIRLYPRALTWLARSLRKFLIIVKAEKIKVICKKT
jgi:hypothetical protein